MEEEGPGSAENYPPVAEPQPRHDFSHVQGFQVVGGEDQGPGDEAWREALRLEMEVRAERLRQSVDAAIVLSNDGIIRWLGDPVAKLSLGPDVLNPSAVILADDSLPDASRVTIKTRIELWIAATTRRLLAPLFALGGVQEGSEIVRDLAREMVRSLGVLEREPIKAKIRSLTQDDRAELRKQGVRFGAYYLFLPTLLKPAARGLALQLWALQASGDASELLRTLGPIASSGRTSLPTDKTIGKDGYRVAGYRACGERIVRVDVVERLAGMIRSAIVGEAPGAGALRQRPSKGFVISGAMTSLTGCAGEPFASILRSMGFRSVEMKRSEFFGAPSTNESTAQPEASPELAENRLPTDEQTPPLPAGDDRGAAESISAAPLAEPPFRAAEGDDAGSEPVLADTDAVADVAEETPEEDDAAAEAEEAAVAEDADGPPDDELGEVALAAPMGVDSEAEGAGHATESTTSAALYPAEGAPTADSNVQAAPPQTPGATGEAAKDADLVVVWRPDHRRTPPRREREARRPRSEGHGPPAPQAAPDAAPNWRREASARPPRRPSPANSSVTDEKRRQRPKDYDMARSTPATAPPPKVKVDPNSPFAKLLELRSLLEEQAKKRR